MEINQTIKTGRIRKRRDKSTKFFTVINTEEIEDKRWKKTDKWREPWF